MRSMSLLAVSTILSCVGSIASAQTATEGPLRAPDDPVASQVEAPAGKTLVGKMPLGKKRSAHAHRQARAAADVPSRAEPDGAASPILRRDPTGTSDPVDFGMKWNGSNDGARGTRVQNYGGDAFGSGAEVGMKLHF